MTTDNRNRLLIIALELRLRSLASGSDGAPSFPPSRLIEIAEALEVIAQGEDPANANDLDARNASHDAKGVGSRNR